MARKNTQPIPGQELLFSGDFNDSPNSVTWQEREEHPMLAAYKDVLAEGVPMVDIADRASRIIEALTEMSARSSVGFGFLTAVKTRHVVEIDKTYSRWVTPIVARNAKNKLSRREQKVKNLLGSVTGYAALRLAHPQLMPMEEVNAYARHDWNKFETRFTGPDNQERREEYKQMLGQQLRLQEANRRLLGLDNTG